MGNENDRRLRGTREGRERERSLRFFILWNRVQRLTDFFRSFSAHLELGHGMMCAPRNVGLRNSSYNTLLCEDLMRKILFLLDSA